MKYLLVLILISLSGFSQEGKEDCGEKREIQYPISFKLTGYCRLAEPSDGAIDTILSLMPPSNFKSMKPAQSKDELFGDESKMLYGSREACEKCLDLASDENQAEKLKELEALIALRQKEKDDQRNLDGLKQAYILSVSGLKREGRFNRQCSSSIDEEIKKIADKSCSNKIKLFIRDTFEIEESKESNSRAFLDKLLSSVEAEKEKAFKKTAQLKDKLDRIYDKNVTVETFCKDFQSDVKAGSIERKPTKFHQLFTESDRRIIDTSPFLDSPEDLCRQAIYSGSAQMKISKYYELRLENQSDGKELAQEKCTEWVKDFESYFCRESSGVESEAFDNDGAFYDIVAEGNYSRELLNTVSCIYKSEFKTFFEMLETHGGMYHGSLGRRSSGPVFGNGSYGMSGENLFGSTDTTGHKTAKVDPADEKFQEEEIVDLMNTDETFSTANTQAASDFAYSNPSAFSGNLSDNKESNSSTSKEGSAYKEVKQNIVNNQKSYDKDIEELRKMYQSLGLKDQEKIQALVDEQVRLLEEENKALKDKLANQETGKQGVTGLGTGRFDNGSLPQANKQQKLQKNLAEGVASGLAETAASLGGGLAGSAFELANSEASKKRRAMTRGTSRVGLSSGSSFLLPAPVIAVLNSSEKELSQNMSRLFSSSAFKNGDIKLDVQIRNGQKVVYLRDYKGFKLDEKPLAYEKLDPKNKEIIDKMIANKDLEEVEIVEVAETKKDNVTRSPASVDQESTYSLMKKAYAKAMAEVALKNGDKAKYDELMKMAEDY